MSELALELIREAKEKRLTRLDLGECGLTEIPEQLFELIWLEELVLGSHWTEYNVETEKWEQKQSTNNGKGNQIKQLPQQTELLSNLKYINLSHNQINDTTPLKNLSNLCWLDLSGNQFKNIVPLRSLTNLNTLLLRSNQIYDVAPLARLKSLQVLSLRSNHVNDISSIINLEDLQILDLRHNRISDITPISKLTSLTSLYLPGNPISDISSLAELISLKSLHLMGINVSNITALSKLINLKSLDLMGAGISKLTPLSCLTKLNFLDLRSNKISDITPLLNLVDLHSLDLRNNEIRDIRPLISLIKTSTQIQIDKKSQGTMVDGNPIENPPREIIEQGNQAILDYFRDLETQGTEKLNEAKLIIVGEPNAGKTSLMETLLNPDFKLCPDTETTLGIEVREGWKFPHPQKPDTPFTTNIWDFGGQQIQYMTHQFFLTPGAAYVLVSANDRKEPTNFPYWFKVIHLLGEEKGVYSPVLVVLNEKDDKYINKFNFDLRFYQERYPELQISVREVDLSKRDGNYQALRDEVQNMLTQLPHVTSERPARWNDIRTTLRERAKTADHITFAHYAEICQQHTVNEESSQLLFSRYLHRLGSLLHFHDDPTLYNFIILNPQWAVDAVYSVLNDNEIARSGGYFSRAQVETIWSAKQNKNGQPRYNHDERLKLLNLMEKENFEICYPLDSDKQSYIAPQLLDTEQPDYTWNTQDCLKFRFQYKFMPEGILTRLIVRLNALIEAGNDGRGLVWRKGVIFQSEGCRAQVLEEENRDGLKVIDIAVTGQHSQRKFLLRDIRKEVQDIHKKWFRNIQSEQMIPCNCEYCTNQADSDPKYFKYSILQRAQQRGKLTVECDKEFIDVAVMGLLEGVFTSADLRQQPHNNFLKHPENHINQVPEQIDVFISYSHRNKIHAIQLAQCLESSGYCVWSDTALVAGDHFRSEIQARLANSKCTVVLWSEAAVKSEWVQEEANYAHNQKRLIPARLDPTELPIPFGVLQTISLENWHGDPTDPCLQPLLAAIERKIKS